EVANIGLALGGGDLETRSLVANREGECRCVDRSDAGHPDRTPRLRRRLAAGTQVRRRALRCLERRRRGAARVAHRQGPHGHLSRAPDALPIPRDTHWTRPELVAQIGFAEWT